MAFTADHRNLGGRDQIIQRINNHRQNLTNIKFNQLPMNKRIKPHKQITYFKTVPRSKSRKTHKQLQAKYNGILYYLLL